MGDVTREMDALAFEGDDLREALRKERTRAAELERERDEARRWAEETVRAIRSERTVTCIFCGQAYDNGTPEAQDAVLYAHIRVCEKHPLRAAERALAAREAEVAELRAAVESKLAEYEHADAEWRALKGLGNLSHDSALVEDWKAVLTILPRPPGSDSALRAMLERCARAALFGYFPERFDGTVDSADKLVTLVVSRLLGAAPAETTEGGAE